MLVGSRFEEMPSEKAFLCLAKRSITNYLISYSNIQLLMGTVSNSEISKSDRFKLNENMYKRYLLFNLLGTQSTKCLIILFTYRTIPIGRISLTIQL